MGVMLDIILSFCQQKWTVFSRIVQIKKTYLPSYHKVFILFIFKIQIQNHLYITIEDSVIAKGVSVADIGLCDHEESDTTVMVHIVHAIMNGGLSVFQSTVDSDVVIISTCVFSVNIQAFPDLQMWILFGQGKNSSVYKVNKIYESLGATRCGALLFLLHLQVVIRHRNLLAKERFLHGIPG